MATCVGITAALSASAGEARADDAVPCLARSYAVVANTGSITLNSGTLVDIYQSSIGPYSSTNLGSNAVVRAAKSIVANGGVVKGTEVENAPAGLAVVPVPAGATNLPLGSSSPGNLNINGASDSITLAPGNYVVSNINVNSPGAIKISPTGEAVHR